jgi:serine/threonine protein kinase
MIRIKQKILGIGKFGEVWLYSINGEKYAIKEIDPKIKKEAIERELEISKKIGSNHNCSGLVKIYDCFKEGEKSCIVMECCSKESLSDLIKKHEKYQKEDVFYLILIVNIFYILEDYFTIFRDCERC